MPLERDEQERLEWAGLLHRPADAELNQSEDAAAALAGKRVLVTGAGGWIGSALVTRIAAKRVAATRVTASGIAAKQVAAKRISGNQIADAGSGTLLLLDAAEGGLHEIDRALLGANGGGTHEVILANICDREEMDEVFERYRPEVVFHAAAFKHVPLMERHPFAVIANNALGTHALAEAAARWGCEQMVMVSTDKAVDPLSLMGASKRIAELVLLASQAGALSVKGGMRAKAVRLGNVLGSSGSVVPLFKQQIARGGPVTVTHPDVRRYFMTTAEAVDALLRAASTSVPQGILVPRMGSPILVLDVAKHLISQSLNRSLNRSLDPSLDRSLDQSAPEMRNDNLQRDIPIAFTALRPGDKMEESLISSSETYAGETANGLRPVESPVPGHVEFEVLLGALRDAVLDRDLPRLLSAVLRLVPAYTPSLILEQAAAEGAAR